MLSLDKIGEYVNNVCQQIRWTKAHQRVSEELTNHVIDGRDFYIGQGVDEKKATEKAISDTGDATIIGTQLDRIHRPKPQWSMFIATAVLLMLGYIVWLFIFSLDDTRGLLPTRLLCTGIGVVGMIVAYLADFTILGKYPKTIYFGVISISVLLLLFSPQLNGMAYYAQYIILLFPLAFSAIVFVTRNKGYLGIFLCGLAFVLPGFIALCVPSVSGFMQFAIIGATLLGIAIYRKWFGSNRRKSFMLMLAPVIFLVIVFLLSIGSNGWNRLAVAFNPSLDPSGAGYIGVMTREMVSGAAIFGQGYVPGEFFSVFASYKDIFYTDLLLTSATSYLGWIAFAVIIGALFFFIVKGFISCFKQKSSLGLFTSFSIMMTFTIQAIGYITFNLGLQFASPISLPLISYGNVATVVNLVLIGFMLSIFRTGDVVEDEKLHIVNISNKLLHRLDKLPTSIKGK